MEELVASMRCLLRVAVCLAILNCMGVRAALALSANNAPKLPPPSGPVVNVSTEPQLQQAVRTLQSGATIMLAPGTYNLTSTLWLGNRSNIALRGATGNRDDVVLQGR